METTEVIMRQAPADPKLERALLGMMVIRRAAYEDVREILTDECFSDPRHRDIYKAVSRLRNRGDGADMFHVTRELQQMKSDVEPKFVMELCSETVGVSDIREHALALRDMGIRRSLWETGLVLMARAADLSEPIEETHEEARRKMESVFDINGSNLITLKDTYSQLQELILVNRERPEGSIAGTPTGFKQIDENGGLCGGDLIVLGAETSQGKTSFATAMAVSAIERGESVAFYSMEMTLLQLTARIGSMRSGIRASKLLNGIVEMSELALMDEKMGALDMGKMYFDGNSTSSLERIMLSIRTMKCKKDIKGVVVDYLQLVNTGERGLNAEQAAAKCARDLKNLAKELNIWVIAISQLRRDNNNPVPTMARLRNSGQIEEAADNVILIYRPRDGRAYPEPFAGVSTEGTALVKIVKGRNVGVRDFICGFKAENTLFYPIDENDLPKESLQTLKDRNRLHFAKAPFQHRDEDLPY